MWNAWYRIDDHTWWVLLWWLAPSEADMPPKEVFCGCHQQPDESLQGHGCSSTKYARVPPCPCSPDTLPITVHGTPVVLIHRLPSPPQPSHHQELLILHNSCSPLWPKAPLFPSPSAPNYLHWGHNPWKHGWKHNRWLTDIMQQTQDTCGDIIPCHTAVHMACLWSPCGTLSWMICVSGSPSHRRTQQLLDQDSRVEASLVTQW